MTNGFRVPAVYNDLFRAASEQKFNLDIINSEADFNRYKIIFTPYQILMDEPLAAKMKAFVEQGGALIVSAHSLIEGVESPESITLSAFGYKVLRKAR